MPKCLECKVELEFDDTVDTWTDGEDNVIIKIYGHCPKCGKLYKWKDVYQYVEFQDLKERD